MTLKKLPTVRVFSQAAWAGPLATLTYAEWKAAGGCGMSSLEQAHLSRVMQMSPKRLEQCKVIEIVTWGYCGRIVERGMARFAANNTDQLKPALRVLANMVVHEFDQTTGALKFPVPPEPVPVR